MHRTCTSCNARNIGQSFSSIIVKHIIIEKNSAHRYSSIAAHRFVNKVWHWHEGLFASTTRRFEYRTPSLVSAMQSSPISPLWMPNSRSQAGGGNLGARTRGGTGMAAFLSIRFVNFTDLITSQNRDKNISDHR